MHAVRRDGTRIPLVVRSGSVALTRGTGTVVVLTGVASPRAGAAATGVAADGGPATTTPRNNPYL